MRASSLFLPFAMAAASHGACAAPVSYIHAWTPQQLVAASGAVQHTLDIRTWALQTLGTDRFQVLSGRLRLGFSDDTDALIDRGLLGYDGQTITNSAYRGTRDGVSGLITQRVVTDWQSRGFENEIEEALVEGVGLNATARSASRQSVTDGPAVETGRSWSGWTLNWWGYSGTETIQRQGERYRTTHYDGDFKLDLNLGRSTLDDFGADGRWSFSVAAARGDFLWRTARVDLVVEALPPSQPVPAPASWALALAGLGGLALRRRANGGRACCSVV
jgi:MYXO-CTERM domain-containing protein